MGHFFRCDYMYGYYIPENFKDKNTIKITHISNLGCMLLVAFLFCLFLFGSKDLSCIYDSSRFAYGDKLVTVTLYRNPYTAMGIMIKEAYRAGYVLVGQKSEGIKETFIFYKYDYVR